MTSLTDFEHDASFNTDHITENWSEYVQSPAQLAFTRLTRFPPGSGDRLIDVLNINSGETLLEVGSGLGILTSRLKSAAPTLSVAGCELNKTYLDANLPVSLAPSIRTPELRGNGLRLPITEDSVDRIFTHALATLINGQEWEQLHDEFRRVLTPGGRVVHMDNIHNDGWTPKHLADSSEEQARREEFNRIHRQVHRELETGYGHTARNLPERLNTIGGEAITVDCYSWVFDLNNSDSWNINQCQDMLNLWEEADRDRIIQFRTLLETMDQLPEHWSTLLDECLDDVKRQSDRRREAIKQNQDIGWRSCTTLAVSAQL